MQDATDFDPTIILGRTVQSPQTLCVTVRFLALHATNELISLRNSSIRTCVTQGNATTAASCMAQRVEIIKTKAVVGVVARVRCQLPAPSVQLELEPGRGQYQISGCCTLLLKFYRSATASPPSELARRRRCFGRVVANSPYTLYV